MSVQYTAIFHGRKNDNFQMKNCDIFLFFAQNIDCGYTLEPPHNEAVLTCTHNLCFRAKIRKLRLMTCHFARAIPLVLTKLSTEPVVYHPCKNLHIQSYCLGRQPSDDMPLHEVMPLVLRVSQYTIYVKVKSMQRSGTEAIRTQIQPPKPKREITK